MPLSSSSTSFEVIFTVPLSLFSIFFWCAAGTASSLLPAYTHFLVLQAQQQHLLHQRQSGLFVGSLLHVLILCIVVEVVIVIVGCGSAGAIVVGAVLDRRSSTDQSRVCRGHSFNRAVAMEHWLDGFR